MKLKFLLFRVKVHGESMWPVLTPERTYWASNLIKPKVGRIAVARAPEAPHGYVIKKITKIENGQYTLDGLTTDSFTYQIPREEILGILI